MRLIPKNVRQIGERDEEIKLYIEDYVNTFIRKCARTDRLVVGALIGDYYESEGKAYLFVEGAVQADSYVVDDGRVRMTDEAWSSLYGKISEFFAGRAICGWFICSGASENCNVGMIRSFMYENIGQDKRALIIHNTEIEEETFAVYDQDLIREQQGYYLFYERNESMQSYMVTTVLAVRTDPVAVDAVTTHVRTRMVEKKEIPVRQPRYSLVSAAALVVGVLALAAGIVMLNHYEKLRELESVLTGLGGNLIPGNDSTEPGSDGETKENSGGLIIEDVNGDVSPSTGADDEVNGTASGENGSNQGGSGEGSSEAPVNGTGSEENQVGGNGSGTGQGTEAESQPSSEGDSEVSGQPGDGGSIGNSQSPGETGADESLEETSPEEETVNATAGYQSYLVEKGDTLVIICWKIYGRRDDALIDEICEINGLEDKNYIYAGQELLIP